MGYEIELDPDALKDLKKLGRDVQRRLIGFLKLQLATLEDPRSIGEALAGAKLGNYWKYQVGDWRIICDIQDRRTLSCACYASGTGARFIARPHWDLVTLGWEIEYFLLYKFGCNCR